jgi:hypothetical protein
MMEEDRGVNPEADAHASHDVETEGLTTRAPVYV